MIEIRLLRKEDKRGDFTCGHIELDYYFQQFAGQNQFKNYIGTNYIALQESKIIAFVSVSTGEIYRENLGPEEKKNLPSYPLSVLRITRLGVHTQYQKSGIGRLLLKQMFLLALEQKRLVGCFGIVIDAKQESVEFYHKMGFTPLETTKPQKNILMFIPTEVIEKAVS